MLYCRIKGHQPTTEMVWNEGRHYSTCKTCGSPILRGGSMIWKTPPPGMKIVWRAADQPRTPATRS